MSDTAVNEHDYGALRLPGCSGAQWFYQQEGALRLYHLRGKKGMVTTWDKDASTGSKYFGYFPDAVSFYYALTSMREEDRHGYELIPEGCPCFFYSDVEWVGVQDTDHTRLKFLVEAIKQFCASELNKRISIEVACGSRLLSNGGFKNSYHLVSHDLVFSSNNSGEIADIMRAITSKPECERMLHDGGKCIVDLGVYTKNRCFRTIGSTKKGQRSLLRRLDSETTTGMEEEDFLAMQITHPKATPDEIVVYQVQKRQCDRDSGMRAVPEPATLPFPLALLENVLKSCGDTASKPMRVTTEGNDSWKVYCANGKKARPCLVTPGIQHKSNNCILFVDEVKQHSFKVRYVCLSKRCQHAARSIEIATVRRGPDGAWKHTKMAVGVSVSSSEDEDSEDEDGGAGAEDECEEGEEAEEYNGDEEADGMSYETVKDEFERSAFKLKNPFMYAIERPEKEFNPFNFFKHTEFRQYHLDVFCKVPNPKNPDGPYKKVLFIDRWIADPTKREYSMIAMDPLCLDPEALNLWRGFLCDGKDLPEDIDIDELVKPIVDHLFEVVVNKVQQHLDWLLDWMANMIQHPERKSMVAIVLFGRQGCGKGIIFDWFRSHVLGPAHTYQTANPDNDCFSRFSVALKGRVFVQVDESKNLHDKNDKLKNIITASHVNIEHKNKDPITVTNLCNFLFTTNNEDCFHIASDDRRMCMFRCSAEYKGNEEYFSDLSNHMEQQYVDIAFYHFLKSRDISRYRCNFQVSRPITDFYEEIQVLSIPLEKRFMSGVVNRRTDVIEMSASDLFAKFVQWSEVERVRFVRAQNKFGMIIGRIVGVDRRRQSGGMWYIMDCTVIRDHLIQNKEFDENNIVPGMESV